MKSRTRDNIIYLAIGLTVAALVVADFFLAESQGRRMWVPSSFAFRALATTSLLGYFVARETRKVKVGVGNVFACVLLASVIHLGITFGFRQTVDQLSGVGFSSLALCEMFLVLQLTVVVARYFKLHRGSRIHTT